MKKFNKNSKNSKAEKLFNCDDNGISRIIPIEEFEKIGLGFGNGGDWIRTDGAFARKYTISIIRSGGQITSLQTTGFATNPRNRSAIPSKIQKNLKMKLIVMSVHV